MELTVYSKSGQVVGRIRKFTYTGNFMQETFISADVNTRGVSLIAEVGNYVVYRGVRFTVMYDSGVRRTSSSLSTGDALSYDGVRFYHPTEAFKHIQFRDIVPNDRDIHYTSMPDFSFWAHSIDDLADRLQANLDEYYGAGEWTVNVPPVSERDPDTETEINIEVNDISVFDALKLVYEKFNTHYVVRGKTIYLSTSGSSLSHVFSYGKGNGLTSIKRVPKGSDGLCTVLRAYGSEENLPSRYYAKFGTSFPKVRFPIYVYDAENYFSIDIAVVPKGATVRYSFEWKENTDDISWSTMPSEWQGSGRGIEGRKWHFGSGETYTTHQIMYIHPSDIDINQIPYKYIGLRFDCIPENIAITRLMLPCFPLSADSHMTAFLVDGNEAYGYDESKSRYVSLRDGSDYEGAKTEAEYRLVSDTVKHDVYVESIGGSERYGRIERAEYFDNDDDREKKDIYPTIEEMTALELRNAGYSLDENIPDAARMDEIVDATSITDDGLYDRLETGIEGAGAKEFGAQGTIFRLTSGSFNYGQGAVEAEVILGSHTMQNTGLWIVKIQKSAYFMADSSNPWPQYVAGASLRLYVNGVMSGSLDVPKRVGPYAFDFYVGGSIISNNVYAETGDEIELRAVLHFSFPMGESGSLPFGLSNQIECNGFQMEYSIRSDLDLTVWNFGLNPENAISDHGEMVFAMKSGLCAGREFSVKDAQVNPDVQGGQAGTATYTCDRIFDEALGLYFPYSKYNILPGDRFVITGIDLPKAYVDAASERLLRYAVLWLSKHDHVDYDYELQVDKVFMAREHESAEEGESLHDTIVEGDMMHIADLGIGGIGIDETLIISSLTIKEGYGLVPEYEVKLRNEITDGVIATLKAGEKYNRARTAKNGYRTKSNKADVRVLTRRVDALENPVPPNA